MDLDDASEVVDSSHKVLMILRQGKELCELWEEQVKNSSSVEEIKEISKKRENQHEFELFAMRSLMAKAKMKLGEVPDEPYPTSDELRSKGMTHQQIAIILSI